MDGDWHVHNSRPIHFIIIPQATATQWEDSILQAWLFRNYGTERLWLPTVQYHFWYCMASAQLLHTQGMHSSCCHTRQNTSISSLSNRITPVGKSKEAVVPPKEILIFSPKHVIDYYDLLIKSVITQIIIANIKQVYTNLINRYSNSKLKPILKDLRTTANDCDKKTRFSYINVFTP